MNSSLLSLLTIALLTLSLVACGNRNASDSPGATETPAAVLDAPTSAFSAAIEDPHEFVMLVIERAEQREWDAIRPLLVEEFREFDDHVLDRTIFAMLVHGLADAAPDAWSVEDYGQFTTIRSKSIPVLAYVLREAESGGWRLDPGPHVLAIARMFQEYPDARGWSTPADYSREQTMDVEGLRYIMMFSESLEAITLGEGPVRVSFEWTLMSEAQAELSIDRVFWETDGERGPVEVSWTTARMSGGKLLFPQPEDEPISMLRYDVSFALIGVPDIDTVTLHIEDMIVRPPGEDPFTVSSIHTIPIAPFPVPDRVDVPPVDDGKAGAQAEPPRFDVVRVDTTLDGDSAEVEIEIRIAADDRVEVLEEPVVVWSDGEATPGRLLGGTSILVATERQGVPEGVTPDSVVFPALARDLPTDADAIMSADVIETKWGDFRLGEIIEQPGGGWSASYLGVGHRWIGSVPIHADDGDVFGGGSSTGFDRDFEVSDARLDFQPEFANVRDRLPLPATVTVREIAREVSVRLPSS